MVPRPLVFSGGKTWSVPALCLFNWGVVVCVCWGGGGKGRWGRVGGNTEFIFISCEGRLKYYSVVRTLRFRRTAAHTLTHTHTRTHARTHAHTHAYNTPLSGLHLGVFSKPFVLKWTQSVIVQPFQNINKDGASNHAGIQVERNAFMFVQFLNIPLI